MPLGCCQVRPAGQAGSCSAVQPIEFKSRPNEGVADSMSEVHSSRWCTTFAVPRP